MEHIHSGTKLGRLLEWCQAQNATDLHGQVGKPFCIRVHGELLRVPSDLFPPQNQTELERDLAENFSTSTLERIKIQFETDLSFYCSGMRYRANFSRQKGLQSFSFRTVPQQKMRLADLQLPGSLLELVKEPRGLVLVTGPTGQGKSTTLRALIQEINEREALRIITIEDPIEYVFADERAQFEQREVGIDTASFADGIRNAMRQDPNVIFVGEIRDRESIFAAMQAAETGHLVLTTLHADSVAQAIGRIREFYPASEQDGISALLGRNLNAIINQRLLPNRSGSRTPCLEVLKRDAGVQSAIYSNNLALLNGIMETAVNQGMHTFDQYLVELLAEEVVTEEVARHYAVNKHRLDMTLRGIVSHAPILQPELT